MQTVAVGVLVTARTGKPGWTGLVAAAAFLPNGLLSPIGGVMTDRMDRRLWLFVTTAGETAFAVVLTVLAATGHASPGAVTLLVLGGGAMSAIGFPAYQAMLPDLVPADQLGPAISLSSAQYNMGRVVGPALAGIAIVAGGYAVAFGINAASFLAVLVALALVRLPRRPPVGEAASLRRRLAEGAQAVRASRPTSVAVLLVGAVALTASPFIALVPAVALKAFHSKAGGTAVLVTAQGIGAVAGALTLTPLVRRFGRRRLLVADLVAVCALLVAYGAAPSLWVGAAALCLVGATYLGVLAGCNTVVQLHAPPALRGRVLGIYMMALGTLYPVGALLQGNLANLVGIRAVTIGGALLLLVLLLAVLIRRIPHELDLPATVHAAPAQATSLRSDAGEPSTASG
jgi:MFS family permease